MNELMNKISFLSVYAVLLSVVILTSGCAYGLRANRTYIKIDPQNISTPKLANKVNFSISANVWKGEPKRLRRHLIPFFIEVQNNTDKNIIISEADFILLDENRNQFNALSPERAANIVKSAEQKRFRIYPRISIGIGTSFHHDRFHYYGHHHHPFYRPYYYYDDYPYPYYRRQDYEPDLEDIYAKALSTGVIRPGATLSGYIFFNKISRDTKELTLEIGYTEKENNTAHKLDFHFDLIEVYYK